jgi:hypothetical protein
MRLLGIVCVLFLFSAFVLPVVQGETAVHGVSWRADDFQIYPALQNNSLIYQNLTLYLYSSEPNSTFFVYDSLDCLFNGTFNFSCKLDLILSGGPHVLSIRINNDSYVYHVTVILQDYGHYWADQNQIEAMIAKKTADALILRAWSAALTGAVIGLLVMSVYMIRRLRQEIVEVL